MKRILLSLVTMAVVSTVAFGATRAFFTDEEKNIGNTFSAGTIDIAVDGGNPWAKGLGYELKDMKPSQTDYIDFVVHNVGTNPANVWKRVDVTNEGDGTISEPECVEGVGDWTGTACVTPYAPKNDISTAIRYDLTVWVYSVDPGANPSAKPEWWQLIYTDGMDVRLSTLGGKDIILGMIPAGWWMKVRQSYHMDGATTNWAQGDVMTFDITLSAEQLKGEVKMDNKNFANADNPTLVHGDGIEGTFTYGVKESKLDWDFTGKAPKSGTEYALLFYYEEWSDPKGNAPTWPRDVYVLGKGTTDGSGNLTLSGAEDLNHDVTNMKVWLATTADLTSGSLGANKMSGWHGDDYLFELGMMDYYDADL